MPTSRPPEEVVRLREIALAHAVVLSTTAGISKESDKIVETAQAFEAFLNRPAAESEALTAEIIVDTSRAQERIELLRQGLMLLRNDLDAILDSAVVEPA